MSASCGYAGNRDDMLVSYLYEDVDPMERRAFEVHLASCDVCRAELDGLRGVRHGLAQWRPPEPRHLFAREINRAASPHPIWTRLREMPAWAQMAAALLFIGVAAGAANLDVRYDHDGLSLRTGWLARSGSSSTTAPGANLAGADRPWKVDLAALQDQLRSEFRAAQPAHISSGGRAYTSSGGQADASTRGRTDTADTTRVVAAGFVTVPELGRRVQAFTNEIGRRQQIENDLALQVGELTKQVQALKKQRQADLVLWNNALAAMRADQAKEGAQVMWRLNYIDRGLNQFLMKTSEQR